MSLKSSQWAKSVVANNMAQSPIFLKKKTKRIRLGAKTRAEMILFFKASPFLPDLGSSQIAFRDADNLKSPLKTSLG